MSKLDANQVLQRAFDDTSEKLKVDASVSATIGTVEVIIDAAGGDNIAITDPTGTNALVPNPDGSVNANISIDQSTDSVKVGDGTTAFTGTSAGSQHGMDVNVINSAVTTFKKDESIAIDETDANNVYIGYAVPGTASSSPSWKIIKLVKSGSITTKLYAGGSASYSNVWDNRATLGYS